MSSLLYIEGDLESTGEIKGNVSDPNKSTFNADLIQLFYHGIEWAISTDTSENSVKAMCVYKNKLYAGCSTNGKIFVFDGSSWTESTDADGAIESLCVYNGNLYAGENGNGKIIVYNTSWSQSTDTGSNTTYSLAIYRNKLYAGCDNGMIFVFNGSSWTESTDLGSYNVYSLCVFKDKLYAGTGETGKIFVFNESSWSESTDTGYDKVNSLGIFNNKLYALTHTVSNGGTIITYDGNSWYEAQEATTGDIHYTTMAVYNGKLWVSSEGGAAIHYFDGKEWINSTDLSENYIYSLASYNGKLYAGTGNNGKIYTKQDSLMDVLSIDENIQNQ
ncbi:MAG: hypothetical protein A2297_10205 [Elusimicrobia bacterium RIFOXYB2_FULL_48_7]|nr:MAG: hypothetical protein A2297_10205 [Elusimicrobia bacterium RIFOXYB2_FULL_48_7]